MPGLPNRQGSDLVHQKNRNQQPGVTRFPTPPPKPSTSAAMHSVNYVPEQIDPMASLSVKTDLQSPLRLLLQNIGVLFTTFRYLPDAILPLKPQGPGNELYPDLAEIRYGILQGWLFLFESVVFLSAIPITLVLPGAISTAILSICCLIIYLSSKPMEGPLVLYSNLCAEMLALAEQHKDERWLFVNGIMVGRSGLQSNIDRIAETFGRAVIGIHNQTYGFLGDLLECLIQRVYSYRTRDVRTAHEYVKATLVDSTVKKVVLIAHSQGGIIVSLVVDQLLTELPAECMSKLEVYTFGSAASHFSNPLAALPFRKQPNVLPTSPTDIHLSEFADPKHVIPFIEHYANQKDPVPRWGVLHFTQDVLNGRYAGSVFVRMGASGHLFNQHYMDPMFPLPEKESHWLQDSFLDNGVQVDRDLATKKESTVVSNTAFMRKQSGLEFGDGQVLHGVHVPGGSSAGPITNGDPVMTFDRTDSGRLLAEEAKGKSVRELSRLWRYQGGRSPHTEFSFTSGGSPH
ncbi:hypothetical protein ACLMJK_004555 [Lecanora helva]